MGSLIFSKGGKMKKIFSILFLMCLGHSSFALDDISCWENNCLKKGWTRTNLSTKSFTDYQCYREGCEKNGWIAGGSQHENFYTQCKSGNCFQQGWFEIDRADQKLLRQISCVANNCFTSGWLSYSSAGIAKTTCLENDCVRKGWQTHDPTGTNRFVKCKAGGCFVSGWREASTQISSQSFKAPQEPHQK
jgi:hypothetical protein